MRIDFVADSVYPYHLGGKEKRLHDLTNALVKQGHEVHVHTMHWWPQTRATVIEDGVRMHALCAKYSLYAGDRRSIMQAVLFSLACLKLLRVPFEHLDVDHMPYFPVLTTWLVARVKRKPLYATWHEALDARTWTKYMGPAGRVAHLIERVSTRLPDAIGTASAATRDNLVQRHGRSRGVHIVGTGVDRAVIDAAPPADERIDLLFVGRLVKDKQVGLLLDALPQVLAEFPETRCVVVGRGMERDRLLRQSEGLGLTDNVYFIESLPEAADVYSYMKAARVFVLPSNREGFGMVVAEALACGTPVVTIASSENAATHLVTPGVTGAIAENNAESLAEALVTWLRRDERLDPDALGVDLDWDRIAERQVEVYR